MADQPITPDQNNERPESGERFLSDTQRIVHRHLENKDDIITEEDIASVRVGMLPPPDEPTERAIEEFEDKARDRGKIDDEEDGLLPGEQKVSPWDTLDPGPK